MTLSWTTGCFFWQQQEGSPCSYNPLDSTEDASGTSSCNHVGVKNYPNLQEGITATAKTLNGDFRGYAHIRKCLASSTEPAETARAIGDSACTCAASAVQCSWIAVY